MKRIHLLFVMFLFLAFGIGSANAQIALQYKDTTTCPGQNITMCAALTGQADPLNADDKFAGVIPIGFTFNYFGKPYTKLTASGNGMVSFDTLLANQYYGWQWAQATSAAPLVMANNSIFVTFCDLFLPNGGKLRYQSFGPVGQRRFIIEWCHIPLYSNLCTSFIVTSQLILYEGSNLIEMHTTEMPAIGPQCPQASPNHLQQVVQGVRNDLGTLQFFPTNRDPVVSPNNWGVTGRMHDGVRFTPNGASTYTIDSIPFNPWVIIDSASSVDLKWYAEGEPNLPVATGACASVTVNANINYYTVKYNGNAGCASDSVSFIDTVFIHFGTAYDTTHVEICAGSTYTWFGKTLFAPGNYDTLLHTQLGCDSLIRLVLQVNPLPDVTIKGTANVQICDGSATTLSVLNPAAGVTYQWTKDGYPITGETGPTYHVNAAGKYNVTATTAKGCSATSQAFTVVVNPNPTATIQPISNEIMCAYDTIGLVANAGPNYDYVWSPGKPFRTVTGAEGQKVKGVFIDPSTQVVLTVFNQYGCYDSDTTIVLTKPCCTVLTPSGFTPNGDGLNDYFNPILQPGQILLTFKVYDRYGKLVYDNGNIKQGWNGAYKDGSEAASGVYMYYMKYTCADGKLYERKESITLLR